LVSTLNKNPAQGEMDVEIRERLLWVGSGHLGMQAAGLRAEHDSKSGHGNLVTVDDILRSGQGTALNKMGLGVFVYQRVNNL